MARNIEAICIFIGSGIIYEYYVIPSGLIVITCGKICRVNAPPTMISTANVIVIVIIIIIIITMKFTEITLPLSL